MHYNKIKYNNIYIYYNVILNLLFVNTEYIIGIYSKIKCETNNNYQFLKFLEYFYKKKKKKKNLKTIKI